MTSWEKKQQLTVDEGKGQLNPSCKKKRASTAEGRWKTPVRPFSPYLTPAVRAQASRPENRVLISHGYTYCHIEKSERTETRNFPSIYTVTTFSCFPFLFFLYSKETTSLKSTIHNSCYTFRVCVCVFFPSILDIKFVGRTSRGHTGGRSHRIFNPPSFCGACLDFCREKDSAIPFPRRP